jgi:hypothetical protein
MSRFQLLGPALMLAAAVIVGEFGAQNVLWRALGGSLGFFGLICMAISWLGDLSEDTSGESLGTAELPGARPMVSQRLVGLLCLLLAGLSWIFDCVFGSSNCPEVPFIEAAPCVGKWFFMTIVAFAIGVWCLLFGTPKRNS